MTARRALLAATLVVAATALVIPPVAAHTAMLRGAPDRDAMVGGAIDFVDLEFLDPVTEASVTVTYNGAPVTGRTTVADGEVISFAFDQALTQPGRYQVSYAMVSSDGDFTTGGYFFTFDPAAPPPGRLEPSEPDGFSTRALLLPGVGLALAVGLAVTFLRRSSRRTRSTTGSPAGDGMTGHRR